MTLSVAPGNRTQWRVHRDLLGLFVIAWAFAAFHLLLNMGRDVHPTFLSAVGAALALPFLPVAAVASPDGFARVAFGALLLFLVVSWCVAARQPTSAACRWTARVSVVTFWIVTWCTAAFSL